MTPPEICIRCGKAPTSGGRSYYCRSCSNAYMRAWREKHKAKLIARQRELAQQPEWRANMAMLRRRHHLKRYGLTEEEFAALVHRHGGKCGICGEASDALCVDHDHDTGHVRGLLCRPCNMAIAVIDKDIELAQRMIEWVVAGDFRDQEAAG